MPGDIGLTPYDAQRENWMDRPKPSRESAEKKIVVLHVCSFCEQELHQGDHIHLSVESSTELHFVVHLRCFRAALSAHNQHLLDMANVVVR